MLIYNEDGARVDSPDLDAGYIEDIELSVIHSWVIDTPEETHVAYTAGYTPDGGAVPVDPATGDPLDASIAIMGKDAEIVVDKPEEGHWETRREDGSLVEDWDGTIPDDWPHDQPVSGVWHYGVYHIYTAEQLDEMERARAEAEAAQAKAEAQQEWLDGAPAVVEDHDAAIVALYEGMTAMRLETDEMLTALYEHNL